jgi:hypothetical protein
MKLSVRDGKFDVLVLAGPRVSLWPSVGVREISKLCARAGLLGELLAAPLRNAEIAH